MSTLVLHLDDQHVQRLASAAARSHQALPEWAAGQLIRLAESSPDATAGLPDSPSRDRMRHALVSLTGIWKDRGTTADLMKLTRGED